MGRSLKIVLLWLLCILFLIHGSQGSDTFPSPRIFPPMTRSHERATVPAYLVRSKSKYAPSPMTGPEGSFPVTSPVLHKPKTSSHGSHAYFSSHHHQPSVGRIHHGTASAPSYPNLLPSRHRVSYYPPIAIHKNRKRLHAPPPYIEARSPSPVHAPFPSTDLKRAPSPSQTRTFSSTTWPVHSPTLAPSRSFSRKPKAPWMKPVHALPPPPPNLDCSALTCKEPLTNPPQGSSCACVLPMKVALQLSVELYAFFPLVSELAQEIASGIPMEQSQVRIMGANAAAGDPEKTIVLINLVPRGGKFDDTTAFLTFEKFWLKQISIKASFFGDYNALYVFYPGLPPSPPTTPARTISSDRNPMIVHPLAVDVGKPKEEHKHSGSLIAIIVLSSVITLVLCVGVALALFLKQRYRAHRAESAPEATQLPFAKSSGTGFTVFRGGPSSMSGSLISSITTHMRSEKSFSLAEIERATDNFDASKVIGEGGFGRVYSGTLEDGILVAVKVLKREDQQGEREFLAEVEILSRLHHRNLVKLIGICTEECFRCLIYELIPNGSVESHLYGVHKKTAPLDWNARMKIALGAARCLAYLHEDSSPHVIHRDFKSSNILLEHDFTPKLCDFGLARTAVGHENEHISTRVMGTFGYVAPEYAMTGHLLVKSDVYSYGVVLLELLTGRKPVDMSRPLGQENLVTWARPLLTSKEGLEMIVDPSLSSNFPFDSLAKVAAIASMCIQPEVSQRPFMGEVVQALKLVCNENNDNRGSCSYSYRESSARDLELKTSRRLGLEVDTMSSTSDIFNISARFSRDESDSFRMYSSSSGPLRTSRSRPFWQWFSGSPAGSVSEHGIRLRPGTGFESSEWL